MVTTDTILVSVDFTQGKGKELLVVGRKKPRHNVDIVNAIQGPDAVALYELIVGRNKEKVDD